MRRGASPLAAFHRIGDRAGLGDDAVRRIGLRPALFGPFRDLTSLRHDYPVVLLDAPGDGQWVVSLADAVDQALRQIAPPGPDGEELRRQVLDQEQAIRSRLASGETGTLSGLWEAVQLGSAAAAPPSGAQVSALAANLRRARDALPCDGEVVACDSRLASRLLAHAWAAGERVKAGRLGRRIARLSQRLADILEVDDRHAPEARAAQRLEDAVGASDRSVFDFAAMSRVLRSAPLGERLPVRRRQRIEAALGVLRAQQFVAVEPNGPGGPGNGFRFSYRDCQQALGAFRERLPAMAELVKAVTIAELEAENHYVESRHDHFFAGFDETRLGPGDLAQFPSYLVCLDRWDDEAQAAVFGVLRAGLPFKILGQPDDLLGDMTVPGGQLSFGLQGQQAARMAMGLDNVFVLQASAASLYRLRNEMMQGFAGDRPALYCIYGGRDYLDAAAAAESRVFPSFVYDPAAGHSLAERFSLAGNPQVQAAWPAHELAFEEADHAPGAAEVAFTPVDFIATDVRFADRFACVPREAWTGEMEPLHRFLDLDSARRADKVPYVLLIDAENVLQRAVVDEKLVDAAERCRAAWESLQELGGIGSSYVAAAEAEWRAERQRLEPRAGAQPAAAPAAAPPEAMAAPSAATAPPQPEPVAAPEPSSDDPWIETIRCTTCNECTQINDRMFAYNEDKRAYIADPDAGTYRQLVEAAESCQVAIIHPGKPRNPDEPGLEELLKRAEPFL